MSESLKDQLRALGLSPKRGSPKPVKRPKAGQRTVPGKHDRGELSLDQAYRMRHKQERRQKQEAVAHKRAEERQRREINRKVLSLIKLHAVRDDTAEIKRNFIYKGRIRSVLVTTEQLQAINEGKLAVVYLSGNYHMMPAAKVEEVRRFAADHVPDMRGTDTEGEEEHPVPDDLTW